MFVGFLALKYAREEYISTIELLCCSENKLKKVKMIGKCFDNNSFMLKCFISNETLDKETAIQPASEKIGDSMEPSLEAVVLLHQQMA